MREKPPVRPLLWAASSKRDFLEMPDGGDRRFWVWISPGANRQAPGHGEGAERIWSGRRYRIEGKCARRDVQSRIHRAF